LPEQIQFNRAQEKLKICYHPDVYRLYTPKSFLRLTSNHFWHFEGAHWHPDLSRSLTFIGGGVHNLPKKWRAPGYHATCQPFMQTKTLSAVLNVLIILNKIETGMGGDLNLEHDYDLESQIFSPGSTAWYFNTAAPTHGWQPRVYQWEPTPVP